MLIRAKVTPSIYDTQTLYEKKTPKNPYFIRVLARFGRISGKTLCEQVTIL